MISPLARPAAKPLTLTQKINWFADFFMAYVPMVMLLMLFFFSVWLVRSMPQATSNQPEAAAAHTVDYDFTDFTLKTYEANGKILSSMRGQRAQHYVDTRLTDISMPFVYMYTNNQVTTAQAKKAVVNEEGTEVQLWGKTLLKRTDASDIHNELQITGEFLHFFKSTDTVVSHLPVVVIKGKNTFKANAMRADNLNQTYTLKGRVNAQLAPHP